MGICLQACSAGISGAIFFVTVSTLIEFQISIFARLFLVNMTRQSMKKTTLLKSGNVSLVSFSESRLIQ